MEVTEAVNKVHRAASQVGIAFWQATEKRRPRSRSVRLGIRNQIAVESILLLCRVVDSIVASVRN